MSIFQTSNFFKHLFMFRFKNTRALKILHASDSVIIILFLEEN